ncbi:MAG: excinuclease ABC subunit UvrB [Bacillota bacterium]
MAYKLMSKYEPKGDQVKAIQSLVENIKEGTSEQVLLGATGTGKTFTMSNVIKDLDKPILILAHNKTLAGQLYSEFKEFFPENRVEYFISYYDYYQPEAYVPGRDLYIEKDAQTNDEIDEMRHSATASLLERRDVIVVASVSCIYGIGDPEDYKDATITIRRGDILERDALLNKLVDMLFQRNDTDFDRGTFKVKGDTVEIMPTYNKAVAYRLEFFDDEVERIRSFDAVTGEILEDYSVLTLFPATQFVTNKDKLEEGIRRIEAELEEQVDYFKSEGKLIEAERLQQRTNYDIEMLKEIGTCKGVENYSRHLSLRDAGETPSTLMDFFGDDYLLIVDESHVTLPQVRGMFNGDRARKQTLVDYGFRLPSALDNRPLNFDEFLDKISQAVYVSATPGDFEMERSKPYIIEQIIRPTGLLDPVVEVREKDGQIDDIINEIRKRTKHNERTLITTLTIKMSEDLTSYLKEAGIKVAYLHSEIDSLERIEIIRDLRLGVYDVLVGINLLREGLDLPEVSFIAILDADKQGFLRSARSLIQTIGRAARNENGMVALYADAISDAMREAIDETNRRRSIQKAHNEKFGITPTTIKKEVRDSIRIKVEAEEEKEGKALSEMNREEKRNMVEELEKDMKKAARDLDFEKAAELRDLIIEIKASL